MNRIAIYLILLVLSQNLFSQTLRKRIENECQNGSISDIEAVYLHALATFAPHRLPDAYRLEPRLSLKCATGLLMTIHRQWPNLRPEQREVLKPYLQRPNLSHSHVSPSGRFRIHYDTTGIDSVSSVDLDQSGIPDYVEEAARAVDTVYVIEVDTLGFQPPPPDGNDGSEYDVYLVELSWAYGYTEWETQLTSNPDTWTSFMVFDNDYTGFSTPPVDALRVTAAHEFHHMIQLGYNNRQVDLFMMEMTSTWMEDVVYDDVNDYYFYLYDFFNDTNIPFDDNNYYSARMYGQCIWFHYLEKRLGNRQFGRHVWEEMVHCPAVQATANVLQEIGHIFSEELALFYGWNYMTGSRADTVRFYPEGNHYPEIRLDETYALNDIRINSEILPTACRYYRFEQNDSISYALIPAHVNWWTQSVSDAFSLEMDLDSTDPLFTELTDGVQVNLVADPIEDWLCIGAAHTSEDTTFILFNANSMVEEFHADYKDIPKIFSLAQNYPNPFNPFTIIPFSVPYTERVMLKIYNILGREVETLVDEELGAGSYKIIWNGDHLPAGVYFYRLEAGAFQDTRKFIVQK